MRPRDGNGRPPRLASSPVSALTVEAHGTHCSLPALDGPHVLPGQLGSGGPRLRERHGRTGMEKILQVSAAEVQTTAPEVGCRILPGKTPEACGWAAGHFRQQHRKFTSGHAQKQRRKWAEGYFRQTPEVYSCALPVAAPEVSADHPQWRTRGGPRGLHGEEGGAPRGVRVWALPSPPASLTAPPAGTSRPPPRATRRWRTPRRTT